MSHGGNEWYQLFNKSIFCWTHLAFFWKKCSLSLSVNQIAEELMGNATDSWKRWERAGHSNISCATTSRKVKIRTATLTNKVLIISVIIVFKKPLRPASFHYLHVEDANQGNDLLVPRFVFGQLQQINVTAFHCLMMKTYGLHCSAGAD